MNQYELRQLQIALNFFSAKFAAGLAPLVVDGKSGPATNHRIRVAKWLLGYDRPLTLEPTLGFRRRLRHPKNPRLASPARIAKGIRRRRQQRRAWLHNLENATKQPGVGTFDGIPVARWMIPHLKWARLEYDWKGRLVSGYRDPAYSEHLCQVMCGAPSCPGRCAGRASNHAGSSPPPAHPPGAIDVSDYETFAKAMAACPLEPRIFNSLPQDPVHFSPTGR